MIRGILNTLGIGGAYTSAPKVNTVAGTKAIGLQSMLGAQRANAQAYSLAAGARGSNIPLAMREAQRRGVMAQGDIANQAMMATGQLEQGAAAQNAQMAMQANLANQQADQQARAAEMGLVSTGIGALAASDERVKRDIEQLDKSTDRDVATLRGGPAPAYSMFDDAPGPRPAPAASPYPRPIVASPPSSMLATYNEAEGEPSVRPSAARITRIRVGGNMAGPGLTGDYGLTQRDVYDSINRLGDQAAPQQQRDAAEAYRIGPSAISMLGITPEAAQAAAALEDDKAKQAAAAQQPAYPGPAGSSAGSPSVLQMLGNYFGGQARTSDKHSKAAIVDLQKENDSLRSMLDASRSFAADVMAPGTEPAPMRSMHVGATPAAQPRVMEAALHARRTGQPAVGFPVARSDPSQVYPPAAVPGPAPSAPVSMVASDERAKSNVHRAELGLEKVRPVSFEYKEPFAQEYGGDRQYGVLAQDLEKAPPTRSLVEQGPGGVKMVDTDRATMLLLAHAADTEKRLRRMEGKRKAS